MTNDYCCNITVLRNSNEGYPITSLDDLNNEMLLEILCRLPCYRTALSCKAVSKRWYSLISDPLFITQAFLMHQGINEKEPSFTFLLTMIMWDKNIELVTAMVAAPCFQNTLWSRILSLQFLPYQPSFVPTFKELVTFKDLVLSFGVNPLTGLGVFYICNPLTQQWMVLPPSQIQHKHVDWAVLTYLEGRGFRVVVVYSDSNALSWKDNFMNVNLLVYISETCQWRDIVVRVQLQPTSNNGQIKGHFSGLVCKGMVCIHNQKYFGAFNPFDVTDTSHRRLTAINLPLPTGYVEILLESDGKLVAFEYSVIHLVSDSQGKLANNLSAGKRIWKLEMIPNNGKQLPQWELISQLSEPNVKGSILAPLGCDGSGHHFFKVVGVHPSKEHFVYLIRNDIDRNAQGRFILYDTKSKSLEALTTTVPPRTQCCSHKLDIPCWPTPIPIPL